MKTRNTEKGILFGGYEHKSEKLVSRKVFMNRLYFNAWLAFLILTICLLIGVVGYHYGGPMAWIDAVHNASMILSGMGPVADIKTFWGKIFSSFYALFSGVAFITNIGILIAPIVHRFFHQLHAEDDSKS
jgi:hypothetical protein